MIISNKDVLKLLENSDRLFRILFGQTQIRVFLGKNISVSLLEFLFIHFFWGVLTCL